MAICILCRYSATGTCACSRPVRRGCMRAVWSFVGPRASPSHAYDTSTGTGTAMDGPVAGLQVQVEQEQRRARSRAGAETLARCLMRAGSCRVKHHVEFVFTMHQLQHKSTKKQNHLC